MTTTVGLAALAALALGVASGCQHYAARRVGGRPLLHPGLALVRHPWWLVGVAASALGLGLQVAALTVGSIVVVQTVMVSCLAWTLVVECLLKKVRPGRRIMAGVVLTAAGIAGVLVLLRPTVPALPVSPDVDAVAAMVAGCGVLAVAGLTAAVRGRGRLRVIGLGVTAGIGYGLTAALIKIVGRQVRLGWTEPVRHPAGYGAVLLGVSAVLLGQAALQPGTDSAGPGRRYAARARRPRPAGTDGSSCCAMRRP